LRLPKERLELVSYQTKATMKTFAQYKYYVSKKQVYFLSISFFFSVSFYTLGKKKDQIEI